MLEMLALEPDRLLEQGEEQGFTWVVIHNRMGFRNGYVKIPSLHPWHGGSDDLDVNVHGGFTYAMPDTDDGSWWVGFDTAHSDDGQDLTLPHEVNMTRCFDGHIWTLDEVIEECRQVCRQAAEALYRMKEETSDAEECS